MPDRRTLLCTLLAAGTASLASRAQAPYPDRPLALVVPYPSGGPGDLIARAYGEVLGERLGQPVVPDFKPGAGGQIAAATLLQRPADGLTLMLGDTTSLCSNRLLYPKFRYDPLADLEPVAPLLQMPAVLYVRKDSAFQSLAEVVQAARTREVSYASQGNGSAGHLLGEVLAAGSGGGRFVHVPYKGSAPAMNDVMAGLVDILFDGLGAGLPYLQAGRLRAIAAAHPQRLRQLPAVPTTAEAGHADLVMPVWFGIVAKAGTPLSVVKRLNEELLHAGTQPRVTKRFTDLGFESMSMAPEAFRDFMRRETDRWGAFIRARRIVLE